MGKQSFSDGTTRDLHLVFAVDPVITDEENLVVINRGGHAFVGKPALLGGFLELSTNNQLEDPISTAGREALEESGIDLSDVQGTPVGKRLYRQMKNIRITEGNGLENIGIKHNDIFIVSTLAVLFFLRDLKSTKLNAGSDAQPGSARIVPLTQISKDFFGPPIHYSLVIKSLFSRNQKKYANQFLISSAEIDDTEGMQISLNAGADINSINEKGNTALIRACCEGSIAAVKLLVEKNADRTIKNPDNLNALEVAIRREKRYANNPIYSEIVSILSEA